MLCQSRGQVIVAVGISVTVVLSSVTTEAQPPNGSFLRTDGQVSALVDVLAHVAPDTTDDPDPQSSTEDLLATAISAALADGFDGLASSQAEMTALVVTPDGEATFTPQVTTTSFHQNFASVDGFTQIAATDNPFQFNAGNASATYELSFPDEPMQGQFTGFLYLVAFENTVLTGETSIGTPASQVRIDDQTFVQSSISVGGSTYTAAANYQANTQDWRLTATLPGGVFLSMTVAAVNHHFALTVPVSDGDNLGPIPKYVNERCFRA